MDDNKIGIHITPDFDSSGLFSAESQIDRLEQKAMNLQQKMTQTVGNFLDSPQLIPASPGMSVADIEGQQKLQEQQARLTESQYQNQMEIIYQKRRQFLDNGINSIGSGATDQDRARIWAQAKQMFPNPSWGGGASSGVPDLEEIISGKQLNYTERFGEIEEMIGGAPRNQQTGLIYKTHQRRISREIQQTVDNIIDDISEEEKEAVKKLRQAGAGEDEVSAAKKPFRAMRDQVNESAENLQKLNESGQRAADGFENMAKKLFTALGVMNLINKAADAYLFSPITTEAQIEAKYQTGFDITSGTNNAQQQITARMNEVVLRNQLQAKQDAALMSILGTGIGAGIGAIAGSPMLGGMIGGGAGSLLGQYMMTEAGAENTELQAAIQRRIMLAQMRAQNVGAARMPILGGSIMGARGLLGFDPRVQEALGYSGLGSTDIEGYSMLDQDLGFYDAFYNRTSGIVGGFTNYFRGEAQLRALGGRVGNFRGRTPEEALRMSLAYTEAAGGYNEGDIHAIDRMARNTGLDPVRLMQYSRTAQMFNRGTDNASFVGGGIAFTRELYGPNSNAKIIDVLTSINSLTEQLLSVNKDARQDQAFAVARIPELLFGRESAYGRIDQKGGMVLSELEKLGRAGNDAQLAFLYNAYGTQDIKEFYDRMDRGIWGDPRNLPDVLRATEGFGNKGWAFLRSKGIDNPDIRNAIMDLINNGGAYFTENETDEKGNILYEGEGENKKAKTRQIWIPKDKIMAGDNDTTMRLGKIIEKQGIKDGVISRPEDVMAEIGKMNLETAKKWQDMVLDMTKEQTKLYTAIGNTEKAFKTVSKVMSVAFEQMEFQMVRSGMADDPRMNRLLGYFQGEGGKKFLNNELAKSGTWQDLYSNLASDKVKEEINQGKIKTEADADKEFKRLLMMFLELVKEGSITNREAFLNAELHVHKDDYGQSVKVIQKRAETQQKLDYLKSRGPIN
ncbi:MAG TPA: hypothetical protein VHO03_16985 [Ignavibacteriales bacterium]|nr:hypothetical protein [Ignavibacteriales bacterium]